MHHLTELPIVKSTCSACREGNLLPFAFSMAFQPIVDTDAGAVFAHEALVRGLNQEGAGFVLSQVDEQNLYSFDQACRVKAIELAAALSSPEMTAGISINFFPNAVYRPETCIRKTLETAARVGMPLHRIIFEVTEGEKVRDRGHLKAIFREYRKHGLLTAIDDFGAGYAGLSLLAEFQPNVLKIDMELVRNIDARPASRAIVRAIVQVCRELEIRIIAEGIETYGEWSALRGLGIHLFQGYYFAKPAFEAFVKPMIPTAPGVLSVPASTQAPLPV